MATIYNSNFDLTIPFSDDSVQFNLAQNTVLSYTVPGDKEKKYSVRFAYNAQSNVFVCLNTAPTLPGAGAMGTQRFNELRPGGDGTQRYVQGGDVIYMATPDAGGAYVGLSLRQLPG